MKKDINSKHFIQQPLYPGGDKAMTEFIYKNLRYPKDAMDNKVEGTVYIEYDIDYKGKVIETRVLQGLGFGCDEEASRVVKLLKFDVGKNRGMKVVFHKKARINFRPVLEAIAPMPPLPTPELPRTTFVLLPSLVMTRRTESRT